jgi:prepilin-type processing-associated H-X9-DG protein/prepilin-type N-terminal cleavage/methylation domain-containing protein
MRITMMPARRRRAGAFTLVELLVVVSIIAVLIGIILPSIGKARESGRRVRCVSNMKQVGHAITSYCMDNDGGFPGTAPTAAPRREDWIYWQTKPTAPAPTDAFHVSKSPVLKTLGTQDVAIVRCPSDDIDARAVTSTYGTYQYSYVMNYLMTAFPAPAVPSGKSIARLTGVKSPASKVLMYEEDENTINDGAGIPDDPAASLLSLRHERGRSSDNPSVHRGNVLFCDGHVDLLFRSELQDPLHYHPTK